MDTKVFRDITYGMYIVTTKFNDINAGCIINTLSQVTSTPHIISINLNKNNYTNEIIKKSKRFNVSIISEQIDKDIISLFGYKTSKEVNITVCTDNKIMSEAPEADASEPASEESDDLAKKKAVAVAKAKAAAAAKRKAIRSLKKTSRE